MAWTEPPIRSTYRTQPKRTGIRDRWVCGLTRQDAPSALIAAATDVVAADIYVGFGIATQHVGQPHRNLFEVIGVEHDADRSAVVELVAGGGMCRCCARV